MSEYPEANYCASTNTLLLSTSITPPLISKNSSELPFLTLIFPLSSAEIKGA